MVNLVKQNYYQNINRYEHIKNDIIKLIGTDYAINHVGSTAIPKMLGKNIIDILIGVDEIDELNKIQDILINNGYYLGNTGKKYYRFLASTSSETKSGDVHIHIAIINQMRYQDFLILKDYLLENPIIAEKYADYKKDIIKKYGNGRGKYRTIKSKYVKMLINDAKDYFCKCLPLSIIMIRHGENINNLHCDNNSLPLSKEGIKQAKKAKGKLKGKYDVLISSISLRACQTSRIIHGNNNFVCDEKLLEKGYGNLNHDGLETSDEAKKRIMTFLDSLKKYSKKRVLLVTHGSLIRLAENIIEKNDLNMDHVDNCTIIMYRRYNKKKEYPFFKYKYVFKK